MTDRIRLSKKMAAEIRRYRNSRDQYYRLVYGQADSPDDAARSVPAIIGKALAHLNEDLEKELDDIKKSRIRAGKPTHVCFECGTPTDEKRLREVTSVAGKNLYCPGCCPAAQRRMAGAA